MIDDKALTKAHISALRKRKKSGARWQKVSEITVKPMGEEESPYRQFVGGGKEPDLATGLEIPRHFSVITAQLNAEIEAEVKGRVRQLLVIAKQILTEQQYAVFILMAVKEPTLTQREVANVLSLSRGRVYQLWKAAREKLQVAYEQRTH